MAATIKSEDDVKKMRIACRLAAEVLEIVEKYVLPGTSTDMLNQICHEHIVCNQNATSACLGYRGFPKSICTSVNQVVCHGIPSEKKVLRSGDIINIDVTVLKDGWHGDTSRMFLVGEVASFAKRLVQVSQECLYKAIDLVAPGTRLGASVMLFKHMLKIITTRLSESTAGMASEKYFMRSHRCSIMDLPTRVLFLRKG